MVFVDEETESQLDDDDTVLQVFPAVNEDTTLTTNSLGVQAPAECW
jgi:hypothetical protein|tara:strand:- start:1558 stop:1695 length:138 start_codon:yes stop_codon:yes gene_type:complete